MSSVQSISFRRTNILARALICFGLAATSIQPILAAVSVGVAPPAVTTPIELSSLPMPMIDLDTNLKEMGETTSQLKHALTDITREVQRQETVVIDNSFADDPFLYDPAWNVTFPEPIYTYNTGKLLPPRSKWLNHFMSEIDSLVDILQSDINQIKLSDAQKVAMGPTLEVLHDTLKNIQEESGDLQILTQVKDIDNAAIGQKAQEIRDDVIGVDNMRKRFLEQLKHQSKETSG